MCGPVGCLGVARLPHSSQLRTPHRAPTAATLASTLPATTLAPAVAAGLALHCGFRCAENGETAACHGVRRRGAEQSTYERTGEGGQRVDTRHTVVSGGRLCFRVRCCTLPPVISGLSRLWPSPVLSMGDGGRGTVRCVWCECSGQAWRECAERGVGERL